MSIEIKTPILNEFEIPETYEDTSETIAELTQWELKNEEDMAQYTDRLFEQNALAIRSFSNSVCGIVDGAVREMEQAREQYAIGARWEEEERKYNIEQSPTRTGRGEAQKGGKDEHLSAGVTLGLFHEAVNTLGPELANRLLGNHGIPATVGVRGKLDENQAKQRVGLAILKKRVDESNWRREMESVATGPLPKHGYGIVRGQWCELSGLQKTEEGDYVECIEYRGPTFTQWPSVNFYCNNPGSPWAEDQTMVCFEKPSVSLAELLANKVVWEIGQKVAVGPDGVLEAIPLVAKRGGYVGLENFIREKAKEGSTGAYHHEPTNLPHSVADKRTVPPVVDYSKPFRVRNYQGFFPFGALIRNGEVPESVMSAYGITITTKGGVPLRGEALARVADRIYWYITVADNGGEAYCIQFMPCPYKTNRHEYFGGQLIPDGTIYGASPDKVGHDVADAADKIFNGLLEIVDYNAFGPTVVPANAFDEKTDPETIVYGRKKVIKLTGMDPSAASVSVLQRPLGPELLEILDRTINAYETRVMTPSSSKGAEATTQTDTLGELNQQVAGTDSRKQAVIRRLGKYQLIEPTLKFILECIDHFLSDEEKEKEAQQAAGQLGIDSRFIFPTAEDGYSGRQVSLISDFTVEWDAGYRQKEMETAQILMKMAVEHREDPRVKTIEMLKDAAQILELNGTKYFEDEKKPLNPVQVIKAIKDSGDMPNVPHPSVILDHFQIQPLLMAMLERSREDQLMQGNNTQVIDSVIMRYKEHMRLTSEEVERLAQMVGAMTSSAAGQQEQQMAQKEAGGGQPKEGGKPGGIPGQQKPGGMGKA